MLLLQGLKWIKKKYGSELRTIQLSQKHYLDTVVHCVSHGQPLLIENLQEDVDPVLDPLLSRQLIKKGTAIKFGDKEVEYHPQFRLYLHSKLANPHLKPEVQALTTLINFTVTRTGLEDQLLAKAVFSTLISRGSTRLSLVESIRVFKYIFIGLLRQQSYLLMP